MSKEEVKSIAKDNSSEELESATPSENISMEDQNDSGENNEEIVENNEESVKVSEEPAEELVEVSEEPAKELVEVSEEPAKELVEVSEEPAEESVEVAEELTDDINVFDYLDSSIIDDIQVLDEEKKQKSSSDDGLEIEPEIQKFLDSIPDVKEHEVIQGIVVSFTDREVLVDIGFKSEGIVPRSEFLNEVPEIGEEIDVYLVRLEDKRGNIILSKEKADFEKRWGQIKKAFDDDEIISGTIIRRIKGGMIVDLGIVQAFLPGSQIDIKPITNFDELVGSESEFKIVKFNEMRQNVVLSRKAILNNTLMEQRQQVLSELNVGMVLEGIVKNITDFGAFIDLGGIDGLLHITDITWGRINHPSDKLSIGETVSVKVIDFDVEKVRVSLGMKQLTPEPWEAINTKYPVDKIVKGKVVNMMNYGAFIELEEGVEGLIHVSEMSWIRHIKHPSDIFSLGDKIEAKILSIDKDDKKISLGIKQLQENPWDEIESKYTVGDKYKGNVKNLTQFGAFVELEEGIEGLVHINDMSWTQVIKHPKQLLKKNDQIEVKVLEISKEDRKLSLGIKQLGDDPWDTMAKKYPIDHKMNCEVLKVLEKGIIFIVDNNIEGIVSIRNISDDIRKNIKDKIVIGNKYDVTVQKVDLEYRKIILIMDEFKTEDMNPSLDVINEKSSTLDKIEVPQDIIDKIKESSKEENKED